MPPVVAVSSAGGVGSGCFRGRPRFRFIGKSAPDSSVVSVPDTSALAPPDVVASVSVSVAHSEAPPALLALAGGPEPVAPSLGGFLGGRSRRLLSFGGAQLDGPAAPPRITRRIARESTRVLLSRLYPPSCPDSCASSSSSFSITALESSSMSNSGSALVLASG